MTDLRTISSQRYLDPAIVADKLATNDFVVSVSPEFEVGGETFRVVLDGHHSLAAAIEAGVEPEWVTLTAQDHDAIALLPGEPEAFLAAVQDDSTFFDISDPDQSEVW